jgi:hypothetical protein
MVSGVTNMNSTPSGPAAKAQQGRTLLKEAILDLLRSYGERDQWLTRAIIEEKLNLESNYEADDRKSYRGALASMLLSELHEERKIRRDKDSDGRTWLYRIV